MGKYKDIKNKTMRRLYNLKVELKELDDEGSGRAFKYLRHEIDEVYKKAVSFGFPDIDGFMNKHEVKNTTDFKIGDNVRILENNGATVQIGDIGVISNVLSETSYNGDIRYYFKVLMSNGRDWLFYREHLELVMKSHIITYDEEIPF